MTLASASAAFAPDRDSPFEDDRKLYLAFADICGEKPASANRIIQEIPNVRLAPSAETFGVFDAGVGKGSILGSVAEALPAHLKHLLVGKEISLIDVRLTLFRMAAHFATHPATVLVLTNLPYSHAPRLSPKSQSDPVSRHEFALTGPPSEFANKIRDLEPFLAENWQTKFPSNGKLEPERHVALVIYRDDCRGLLDGVIPRKGGTMAGYDLVIASHVHAARATLEFKANLIAGLAEAVSPGGRFVGIHAYGRDRGLGYKIVQAMWPGYEPFIHTDPDFIDAANREVAARGHGEFKFKLEKLLRYNLHPLADRKALIEAAWSVATYVAQIPKKKADEAIKDNKHLKVTDKVLRSHKGATRFYNTVYTGGRELKPALI